MYTMYMCHDKRIQQKIGQKVSSTVWHYAGVYIWSLVFNKAKRRQVSIRTPHVCIAPAASQGKKNEADTTTKATKKIK